MAIQEVTSHSYKDIFSLQTIQFERTCVINKPQRIDEYKIFWIKEGSGKYSIDFETYSFEGNVLCFLSPGQIFSVESENINKAHMLSFVRDFYCIQTHDSEIACNGILFNNIYETPFVKPCEKDTEKLNFIIESLKDELKNTDTAQYDMLQAYLKQFIIHSVRIKKEHDIIKEDSETKLFKDFSLLVEQNFKKLHSVTDYANRLGISPKSLAKHFQKIGAKTPSDFIKDRVITEAKRQLLYSTEAIKNIAFDLGFNDPAYFSRFFTKATGQSPKQFQKEQKA
ncbi:MULTISPECIES: helix-turn-helix domain-containing protein [unclassified Tenacibaculum]|uniref:helix-turn-helix domain-containing protein n=1 Tax=unclassified Tenacibaculum TaxID=2635139 RepID=UPI001F3F03CD|nr:MULTISPECIES: helix-turn-helix domain-containing protein [unclassified Tenacibaculum]MCF2874903.1 helix-turn-helix domain-containing protein [Tenacibaculum sp. Cn5-1]MCF2934031.1 helix-turn-helix domain-containing protein [Tenacibaculum sp. Cn5-34]MCG7510241.1 helix-turn-helix domain-containing protein [Tenacibaculum sp. Cn5-46]